MANLLKMAISETIRTLHRRGWSQRRIADELGINRETIARHLQQAAALSKPANAPPRLGVRRRLKTSQCAPRLDAG
jgi:IS30 family transposase